MKKLILILSFLWLSACTGTVIGDGNAVPTIPLITLEPTAVSSTPTLMAIPTATNQPPATAVPPTAAPIPATATQVPAPQPIRIQFAPGATSATLNGRLAAGESIEYLAWAEATQWTQIELISHNNVANFSLVGLSDGQPLKRMENESRFWEDALTQTQDYQIRVHTLEATDFSLTVSIAPTGGVLQPVWPIVDGTSGFLLGGTHNGQWQDAFTILPSLQDGERPYNFYAGTQYLGPQTVGPPTTPHDGPCGGTPVVLLPPNVDLSGTIGIVARWEAAARPAQSLPLDTAVYVEAVGEFLQTQGIADPEVHLTSVNQIDLEGDGVDEVLITAARLSGLGNGLPTAAAGDYSIVILRKVVNDTVVTIPLAVKVFPAAVELADPVQYNILAMLDLNGDGKLEMVVEGIYFEGRFVTVYESINQTVQPVLTVGCRL